MVKISFITLLGMLSSFLLIIFLIIRKKKMRDIYNMSHYEFKGLIFIVFLSLLLLIEIVRKLM
jgi:Mn2+/Fe2+ NRAMP family transporter